MIGLNSLSKVFRRSLGPRFESSGLLPRRYYLLRAVAALEADDIDEAVQMISLAASCKSSSLKWRLVCQQIIFRCRVLGVVHERRIDLIKNQLETPGKAAAVRERYLRLQKVEERARRILQSYERRLVELLEGCASTLPI
ncbi:MAG: hypothetical protein ACLFVT_02595 [Syntrophobacteria bacterium]